MPILARVRRAATAAVLTWLCAHAPAHADLAQDHARAPEIATAQLSPSGRYLAMLTQQPGRATGLTVLDLVTQDRMVSEAADPMTLLTQLAWVNEDRLVISAMDIGNGVEVMAGRAGLYAVNRDGSDFRELIRWRLGNDTTGTRIANRTLNYEWSMEGVVRDGSADIWVVRRHRDARGDWTHNSYARLNTADGALKPVPLNGPEHVQQWLRHPGGQGDVVVTVWNGRQQLHHRAGPGAAWRALQDEDAVAGDAWQPLAFLGATQLLVKAHAGQDTLGLYTLDLAKGQLSSEPVVAVKGFDLHPSLALDGADGPLLGLRLTADGPLNVWFDPAMDQLQRSLDAALPKDRRNTLSCSRCGQSSHVLVWSRSDRQPGELYVYSRAQGSLQRIGESRPWLKEEQQPRRTLHRVATRDGQSMPVYITHPAGKVAGDRLPAVMLVHGGPWVRGANLAWDAEAAYLASLGYRVIEPEFRGSTGYGARWTGAGRQAWGRAMQDDLLDAVAWADGQRLIDPKKVCIMGGSYGGYAALMGAVRDGAHYRCSVAFAAVSDIGLLFKVFRSDMSDQVKEHFLQRMVGDPDAASQREVSPLVRAAEVQMPLLVVHGMQDRRVPIDHARRFVDAARAAKAPVELVTYDLEGHGFINPVNRTDYYRRVGAFLQRHLGDAAAKPGSP